jgi:hypothetical protein
LRWRLTALDPMSALLLIAAGGLVAVLLVASVVAAFRPHATLARALAAGGGSLAAAYVVALAAVNHSAPVRLLQPGQTLRFCGFYLDCHMAVTVEGVRVLDSLGARPFEANPGGEFWMVTVRVSSDARRATLRLANPSAYVVDRQGRRHNVARAAQSARTSLGLTAPALDLPVEAGASYTTDLIFDLPRDGAPFRLRIVDGAGIDRAIESLLIGDDDGFLHPRPAFALAMTVSR